MTAFEKTLKNHSSEIEDFRDFGEFCSKLGFQADLIEDQREEDLFLHEIGREIWRVTDKRSKERMGLFAIDYVEESFGFYVSRRQTLPFRMREIYEMEIVKRYERIE